MRTPNLVYRITTAICLLLSFDSPIYAQVKAGFSAPSTEGCAPIIVKFKDESTGNPTSWRWDLGNGTVSFLQHPAATYFNPGTYAIKLVVRNGAQADSVVKVNYITVFATPAVNFSASDTTGCFPLNVQFKDLSDPGDGTTTTWQWDFGDGITSTEQNPEHRYTAAGDFTVSLRVFNSHGCAQTVARKQYISLHNGVKADFTFVVPNSCKPPTAVHFTNKSTGTGALSYTWDFGDGQTVTEANPVHTYTTAGTFSVKLLVRNQTGCTDSIINVNIIHIGTVKADFAVPALACSGQPVTIVNNTTPAPVSVYWAFGDGTNATTVNPVKTYTQPGSYTIRLVSDFGACKDSVSRIIEVLAIAKADFSVDDSTSCKAPFTVKFNPNTPGVASYQWLFGDGGKSTDPSPAHTYTAMGEYDVTLIVTNAAGCTDTLVKQHNIQIKKPVVTLSQLSQEGCAPFNWQPAFTVNSIDELTGYTWYFGDGTTSTEKTPNHVYTQAGTYTVKLVYTTAGGCTDSVVVKDAVRAGNHPTVAFTATPRDVCAYWPVNFKDGSTGAPADKWLWSFGDGSTGTAQNPIHIYQDTGHFTIKLVVWSNGCKDSLTVARYIHIKPPIARFDISQGNCDFKFTRNFTDQSIGANSWYWDFGDGTSSTQQNPSHTYTKAGSFIIKLTVKNDICENTTSKQVLIISEHADFRASDTVVCKGTPVALTAINSNAQYVSSYNWLITKGTATIGNPTGSAVSFAFPAVGRYNIRLAIKDIYGCADTLYKNMYIKVNGPTADFGVVNPEVCSNSTVFFADSSKSDGQHPIQQWSWDYGDGVKETVNEAGAFMHLYTKSNVYPVALTVTDSLGCADTRVIQHAVTVSRPAVQFVSPDTMSCSNKPIRFTNQTTGNSPVYTWYFGDGSTTAAEQPTHNYTAEGDYTVKLVVNDRYGCTDSVTKQLYIHIGNPMAHFSMSDSFATCPPLMVNFTNQSKYYSKMEWDFGDGNKSSQENPSHFYTYPGIYRARVTITSPGGCIDTFVKIITIKGPQGTFTYDKISGCVPTNIQFTAQSSQAIHFVWDYNDGTVDESDDLKISHEFASLGAYLPKMILIDPQGCRVPVLGKDTIRIYGVNAAFTASKELLCDSGLVQFNNNTVSNDLITSYSWLFGDGKSSAVKSPAHFYTQNGHFATQLIVTTQNGCKDTTKLPLPLKIVQSPQAAIESDSGACVPAVLHFRGSLTRVDTSAVQWRWDFGNGTTSRDQVPAIIFATAGQYTPTLLVINSSGCSDTVIRIVNAWPLPAVDAGADQIICLNSSATLTGQGAVQYNWFPATNLSCTNCSTPLASPLTDITYAVTGKNIYGCSATDSIRIAVQQPFTMQAGLGDTLCKGESFQLRATGAEEYLWSPSLWMDNSTSDKPKVRPDTTVTYRVIGRDRQHCFADTAFVPVVVYNYPVIEAGEDQSIPAGGMVALKPAISADVTSIRWLPATGLSCATCATPSASPRQSVMYTLEVANKGGCKSRDQVSVFVFCNNANVFVPNTFSPNGDGNNDVFYPRGKGIYMIQSFRVFNRWGDVVYEQINIQANDIAKGWLGLHKGKPAPQDVYIYSMDVICENNVMLNYKGNVALIR